MWEIISVVLLLIECLLLTKFIVDCIRGKKFQKTALFVAIVFILNLALYFVPYLYRVTVLKKPSNYAFDILNCFMGAVQNFIGGINTDAVADFAEVVPVFTYVYLLGSLMAVLGTVSAALEAFSNGIANKFRLSRMMKKPYCDLVIGEGENARNYVKNGENALFILGEEVDKATVVALEEEGFTVLRRNFSATLLRSALFKETTRYNILCPKQEGSYEYLTAFIEYKKKGGKKNIFFYIEQEEEQEENLHREVLEKNGLEKDVVTFCSEEMLARTFIERHPVTEMLPADFLEEDGSIAPNKTLSYTFLGYGKLSQQIYRQSVLNNQVVCFAGGEYKVLPIRYRIYEEEFHSDDWNTADLERALSRLVERKEEYFPLPELPLETKTEERRPFIHSTLQAVVDELKETDSYHYIVVDTGDVYRNIETGVRLDCMLYGRDNYHIFVRAGSDHSEDAERITYYGAAEKVFTHEVIVNDSLSLMAKQLHRVYIEGAYASEKAGEEYSAFIDEKAEESWRSLDYFTTYSNLYAAMNLRLKLHLLGLDYCADGKGAGLDLLEKRYRDFSLERTYADYFVRSKRNALLAQEHARWNAYHLLAEYLPLKKSKITVRDNDGKRVKFTTKDIPAKKHACLTTFKGLDEMGSYLAAEATRLTGTPHSAAEYDVYQYDEMLLLSARALMKRLGYSLMER